MFAGATALPLPTTTSPQRAKLLMRSLFAFGIAAALGLSAAKPADAFTYNGSGNPGAVSVPVVQGTHYSIFGGWIPELLVQGMTVGRSSSSTGAQYVSAAYRVYRWSGTTWAYSTGSTVSATIGAGYQGAGLPTWTIFPTTGRGYYYVETTLNWTTATGAWLGTRNIFWNTAGDYQCATVVAPCTAGTGWVYLG